MLKFFVLVVDDDLKVRASIKSHVENFSGTSELSCEFSRQLQAKKVKSDCRDWQ